MLDFQKKARDDSFAQYFEEVYIITKTLEKPQMAKANNVCKTYYRTLEYHECQKTDKSLANNSCTYLVTREKNTINALKQTYYLYNFV